MLGGCLALLTGTYAARAAGPDNPQVQQMLKRATEFLLKSDATAQSPGHDALLGLALYKAGFPADHPRVKQSIQIRPRVCPHGAGAEAWGTVATALPSAPCC